MADASLRLFQALSKALSELRSDMVRTAAESVRDRARSSEDSLNVQQIVEKQTKDLQDQLSESKVKLDKLKLVVRKCKEEEVSAQNEMAELRDELKKKEFELRNKPERDVPTSDLFHVYQVFVPFFLHLTDLFDLFRLAKSRA